MVAPAAGTTGTKIPHDAFNQIRPWETLPVAQHDHRDAYRQPIFRMDFDRGTATAWTTAFNEEVRKIDRHTLWIRRSQAVPHVFMKAKQRFTYLEQMAQVGNPINDAIPAKDGSNLQGPSQSRIFQHLRHLFYLMFETGLVRSGDPDARPLAFANGLWNALVGQSMMHWDLHNDHLQSRPVTSSPEPREEFDWLPHFRRSLKDACDTVEAAWRWAWKPSEDEAVVYHHCLKDIPEMTKLLAILLEREESFDETITREHIFGCLFDKRIQMIDPHLLSLYHDWAITRGETMLGMVEMYDKLGALYSAMSSHERTLKQLFDYRYLMEWHYNRMWDRLYVIINPNIQISDQCIKTFTDWAKSNGTVAENVFGVHPITAHEMRNESCTICLESFSTGYHPIGVMLLKTKCGHWFHPTCIFSYWDERFFYQNRCPLCRASAGRLRDAINFQTTRPDLEHEDGVRMHLDNQFYQQVDNRVRHRRRIAHMDAEVLQSYWLRRIEDEVLAPMHNRREQARPSWDTVLGR